MMWSVRQRETGRCCPSFWVSLVSVDQVFVVQLSLNL